MELTGALEGLRLLPEGHDVQVFTTSDYLYQGATRWIHGWQKRNWRKKDGNPVANGDLWRALLARQKQSRVIWVNAKGEQPDDIAQPLAEAGKLAAAAAGAAVEERP